MPFNCAATVIDRHVGARLRARRLELRVSQIALAALLGVKHQAIHYYEAGSTRLSASRLWDVARHLNVGVEYFFEGLPPPPPTNRASATQQPVGHA